MNVETWRDGAGGRMSSICGSSSKAVKDQKYDVYMISGVTVDGVSWEGTADHSKWGTTTAESGKTVSCVGDINRMCSQEKRGGGAMCSADIALWTAFNSVISGVEGCYAYDPCQPYGHSSQCYWCSASG